MCKLKEIEEFVFISMDELSEYFNITDYLISKRSLL